MALEELALATLEELALTLLFEDVPCCTFAEDVPGMTLAEESCGCVVADEVPVTTLVEDAWTELGVAAAEDVRVGLSGRIWMPPLLLSGALVASSEQFMNARTDPRTRTDFRNWCFISILIYQNETFLRKYHQFHPC